MTVPGTTTVWRGHARGALLAAALLAAGPGFLASCPAPVALAAAPTPARAPDLQAKIAAVSRATTEPEAAAALAALRVSVAADFSDLVPQLALFLLDADGERAGMTPALIVSRLGITRGQILRALEPCLGTPDAKLRAQLENLLGAVELEDVRALVVERGGAPPSDGLVRYLYARSPADAVAVLAPVAGTDGGTARAVPDGVTAVEDARAALASGRATDAVTARAALALDALSRDPDWRLRAYAAAVLRDAPTLVGADGATLRRLAGDDEPRVRAVARDGRAATAR